MNQVASALFSTPLRAVFLGASLALGFVSSGFSFIFFLKLRHRSLLYFSLTILASYSVLGLLNRDPLDVFDVGGDPVVLRLIQVVTAAGGYAFYCLVLSAFPPHPSTSRIVFNMFRGFFALAIFGRAVALVALNEPAIIFSSLTTGIFEVVAIAYVLSQPVSTRAMRLSKVSCCLFCFGLMIYPLTRAGVLPPLPSREYSPFIQLGTISIVSTVWLFALVEYARERIEQAEMASLKNMARAFIQLRDLMNTPLQTIELSMSLLPDDLRKDNMLLTRIAHALSTLRTINVALARYEKDVDWEQEDNFLDITNVSEGDHELNDDSQAVTPK